ncbi:NNP family nitrate/nitrite transporter-like MFS transporter [Evansella vedderi]|uniref:NNP family nitrate/nitrite transporter-like MFS transporter n=1 Tax=Evansella vedderi TaxID=38282 RepID=A0ABT9ZVK7_9BACI|nr:MFS transporter [Evansella vedderi]MDQ0255268.1 NNP family nitrate/nitrite transporter-like MFS transporter [Evansella vedderi]
MNIRNVQLPLQTLSLVAGFMVWVMLSPLMPYILQDIPLTSNEVALVTAVPIILGSLLRIPLGYWANRFGARRIFFLCFVVLLPPINYISLATSFIDLLIGGLFLGVGGAIFSIGVTSLPKYFPKERHGTINAIYALGNLGTAITSFLSPIIAGAIGWSSTVQLSLLLMATFALLNFIYGDKREPTVTTPLLKQVKGVYKSSTLWLLCFFYFITFGAFVAFTVYLPNFLVSHFGLSAVDAGVRTAGFILLATLIRPLGGWLSDKYNALVILMFVFGGLTFAGVLLALMPNFTLYTIGCLIVALSAGIGNGAIFKLVPLYFSKQAGIVNGLVGAMGGLGGFFPPIILTFLYGITGHYAIGFMALSQVALASLILAIWMFYQEKLSLASNAIESTAGAVMITDTKGRIKMVNPSFVKMTGYTFKEAVGETPRLLKSEEHGPEFYSKMWQQINKEGHWQGEIRNKRKNGEIFLVLLSITPIKNEQHDIIGYVGMLTDMEKSFTLQHV